jgi:hypothetical protein
MTTLGVTLICFAMVFCGSTGDPLYFFPRAMLPPVNKTFTFAFEGLMMTLPVSGIYAVQPATDHDMKTIIGYRNWQSYTGGYSALFYGVSYFNGTYLQALIDPNTQECTNVFSEELDCTGWLNTEIVRWDSRCSLVRTSPPITGKMSTTLRASTSDLMRPLNSSSTVTITGSPDTMTISYEFLSKTDQKNFPYVKCAF